MDDYAAVLSVWPGGDAPESKGRASLYLARYRDHLLRFANGEELVFAPVPSRTPDSPDATVRGKSEALTDPRGRIKACQQFVGFHAHLLSRWCCQHALVFQLAFNSARGSPVSQAAERLILASSGRFLLEPAHLRLTWNSSPGMIGTVEAHPEPVASLDFSADGRHLLSLGANRLTLWEIKHHDSFAVEDHPIALPSDVENVYDACFTADAARVILVESSGLLVLTPEGTCERQIATKESDHAFVITADAKWAATFAGRVFSEWDLQDGVHYRSVTTQNMDMTPSP